jgi:D-arginine dehydrogenase
MTDRDAKNSRMSDTSDILVIGAGMAGASVAAHLAADRMVILLEMEDRPGYHTTGRSAALYEPNYGPPVIQALSRASKSLFDDPPQGFAEAPILSDRPTLFIVPHGQADAESRFVSHAKGVERLKPGAAKALVPVLREEALLGAYIDRSTADIDVDLLHQGYLRLFRNRGGRFFANAEALELSRAGGSWTCRTRTGSFNAAIVVNAAGAWGDVVAARAGVSPLGLVPKRRSAALIPAPGGYDVQLWPATADVGETFYFKPTGGALMISPADATPVEPHDAFAEDKTIAEGIDRLETLTTISVTHLQRTWAGLRTFAPHGSPVVGEDPDAAGFFWLVGQGGYGIQTAPALSLAAAALINGQPIPDWLDSFGVTEALLSPRRFC